MEMNARQKRIELSPIVALRSSKQELNAVREVLIRHGADPESEEPLEEMAERLISALVRELGAVQRKLAEAEEAASRR
jgi:hypothetical protein